MLHRQQSGTCGWQFSRWRFRSTPIPPLSHTMVPFLPGIQFWGARSQRYLPIVTFGPPFYHRKKVMTFLVESASSFIWQWARCTKQHSSSPTFFSTSMAIRGKKGFRKRNRIWTTKHLWNEFLQELGDQDRIMYIHLKKTLNLRLWFFF